MGGLGAFVSVHAQEKKEAPAWFQHPLDVAVAPDGTVYIADRHLPGIWRFREGKLEIYFHASKRFRTPLNAVRCVAIDHDGKLLAGDSATWEVYRFEDPAKPKPLAAEWIGKPMGIAVTSSGDRYVADLEVHRIWKLVDGGKPKEVGAIPAPVAITIDRDGQLVIISRGRHQVRRMSPSLEKKDKKLEIVVEDQPFAFPQDLVYDAKGRLIVSDGYGKCLWRVEPGKKPEKWVASPKFQHLVGLAYYKGKVYVADSIGKQIWVVDESGDVVPLLEKPSGTGTQQAAKGGGEAAGGGDKKSKKK